MNGSSVFVKLSIAALLMVAVQAQALEVRVEHSKGVPRITVNNKPVRARIFYGQPLAGPIEIPAKPGVVTYEFVPEMSATAAATMHIRLGQSPGDIYLDDIRILDLTTGQEVMKTDDFENGYSEFESNWRIWPPEELNTVGKVDIVRGAGANGSWALHVKLTDPPVGDWPDFHLYHNNNLTLIAGHTYRVSFWANSSNARNITNAFYLPGTVYTYIGGPAGHYESQVALAAAAGVDFVSTSPTMPWPAPGEEEDWAAVDALMDTTLKTNPKALIIPRIPVYAPEWWLKMHPDETMRWESSSGKSSWATPASSLFQKEASKRLQAMIEHLEKKYPENMAGYHPVGQNTGEWFYVDTWDRPLNGYSKADIIAFRKWLKTKYTTADRLRLAWKDMDIDFDTCQVPSAQSRHSSPGGVFRDPQKEQPIIDFVDFQQQSMADSVLGFAKVARKASQGKKLVLFFYGYSFEFAAISTGAGTSGHYALRKVLQSPDIDILCSPISYFDRGRGESGPCMTCAESVTLAGKMWLTEDDTRTHLTKESLFPWSQHILNSVYETNQQLIRNATQVALRNFATWWMDLGATGWFDDPGIWSLMKQLGKLDNALLNKPVPFKPEVAVVLDEKSMMMLSDHGDTLSNPAVYEAREALGRMGAPYGQYLLDDVANGKVKAKLYVFVSAWKLSSKTRQALLKATKGSVCIWCYAPGYFEDGKVSPGAMDQLTGFKLKELTGVKSLAIPSVKELSKLVGTDAALWPLFKVSDAKKSEVLAHYADGSPAICVRGYNGGTSMFSGTNGLSSELLRYAAKKAGVHLFTQTDCNVYASGAYLSVHAPKAGAYVVNTGANKPVWDVLSGKKIGTGPVIKLDLKYAESKLMKIK